MSRREESGREDSLSAERIEALRDCFKACMRSYHQKKGQETMQCQLQVGKKQSKELLAKKNKETSILEGTQMDALQKKLSRYLDAVKKLQSLCASQSDSNSTSSPSESSCSDSQEQYLECISILQSYFLFGKNRSYIDQRMEIIEDPRLKKHLEHILDSLDR